MNLSSVIFSCSSRVTKQSIGSCSTQQVHQVATQAELEEILLNSGDALVCIDFTATWCSPCQQIAPAFQQLSEELTNVVFLKVDVDENEVSASSLYTTRYLVPGTWSTRSVPPLPTNLAFCRLVRPFHHTRALLPGACRVTLQRDSYCWCLLHSIPDVPFVAVPAAGI